MLSLALCALLPAATAFVAPRISLRQTTLRSTTAAYEKERTPVFNFDAAPEATAALWERIDDVVMGGVSSSKIIVGDTGAEWRGIVRTDGELMNFFEKYYPGGIKSAVLIKNTKRLITLTQSQRAARRHLCDFLRDWRATIISALAIPLSAIPAFWFMDMLGFTLNQMTLLALSLVAGVLVDDAIVEIENIVRHMRMGKSAYQASIDAADEIGLAVLATTMAIVAVFLPVALMPGAPGQYFKNFGLTVVGLDYGFQGQMGVDKVRGGSPYGATTLADSDGSRQPGEEELEGARYQGRRIAETAIKLHG